ncbi:MAG: type VI secretion system contractile sheath small subunit [Pirellulaceae bacterium]
MSDSRQHTLDRVRRPRVQVTYDVDTGGATESKELPLVVGVMADLSGQPAQPNAPLKERKFVPIDRDNFDEVLAKSNARVSARVDNKLTDDDTQMSVDLRFRSLEDFEPEQVARQVPALRELLEMRTQLSNLLGKLEGNDKLEELLTEVLENSEAAKSLASELGNDGDAE